MKYKLITVLILFLFLILSTGVVSAEKNDLNSQIQSTGENPDIENYKLLKDNDHSQKMEKQDNSDKLSATYSFNVLSSRINGAATYLNLSDNYRASTSDNFVYIYGKSSFYLNGNNHELDFNGDNVFIYIYNNNVVLNNITFKNAANVAVMCAGNNCTIINCNFVNNNGHQAPALRWFGSNGYMENVSFINNNASTMGAVAILGSNNVFNNLSFINNTAIAGGALAIGAGYKANNNKIKNSRFINNSAIGGWSDEIQNADAGGFAAAFFNTGNGTVVENTVFIANSAATGSGGGFYSIHAEDVVVNNCTFINNTAIYAGACYLNGINNTLNNSHLENNTAYDGAGVYLQGQNNTISNSTFKNNHAYYGGGAITASTYENSLINNCLFENNSAGNYGGALSIWKTTIDNCTFKDNSAIFGGGVYTVNSTVKDSTFINNNAQHGKSVFAIDEFDKKSDIKDDEIVNAHQNNLAYATSSSNESYFINLTNGYMGFCAEKHNQPPRMAIQTNNMTLIRNTFNHKDVSEYLKILFYVFVDHVDDINKLGLQELVWQFTHEDFEHSSNEQIKHTVELYNSGFRVNTLNAVKTLKNGTLMVYNFASAITTAVEQNMFLFRFEYRNNTNQSVDKKALNKTVFVGDEFKYEITVKNTGNETLNEVYIEDVDYTSNMMFLRAVNGTGNWVYSNKTLEVLIFDWNNLTKSEYRNITSRWILTSSLQPGENATIILIFKALSNGTAINNITSGFKNLEIANATNNETKIYNPNLTVEKITITPIVKPGSLTTFKIIVTNTGDVDLNDVFVVESSYFGLEYDSFEGVNWMKTGNKFNYLPTLKIGENASFNITFKAVISGNLTNIVIAGSNETDNKTGNNTTKVLKPDIKISKITLNKTVKVGEEVVFEIIVENTGELDLDNVFVRESKYDAELVYQRYVSNNGNWIYSFDENKHKFSLNDTLKVGESASFYVIFIATAIGEFSNTATVGYDNKTIGNSTNTTEVVNKTNPNENKTNPDKPAPPIHKPPVEKKTNKKTQIKEHIDKATGNPLIILLLALFILPIRRFIK